MALVRKTIERETADYYQTEAQRFVDATADVDMGPLYRHFLPRLPHPADILDVGCGSGRDSLFFQQQGHRVSAIDASPQIAAIVQRETSLTVTVQRVQDISFQHEFDGIWASASLLHVPQAELPEVFERLARALRTTGLLYCSFKYGHGEHQRQGRWFTDMDEKGLLGLLEPVDGLTAGEVWVSADRRPGREHERWLNAVLLADTGTIHSNPYGRSPHIPTTSHTRNAPTTDEH
jgi:SAM-dependent methyltransferase